MLTDHPFAWLERVRVGTSTFAVGGGRSATRRDLEHERIGDDNEAAALGAREVPAPYGRCNAIIDILISDARFRDRGCKDASRPSDRELDEDPAPQVAMGKRFPFVAEADLVDMPVDDAPNDLPIERAPHQRDTRRHGARLGDAPRKPLVAHAAGVEPAA